MSPNKPPVALFDSAAAMAQGLAALLHGRTFVDLGQPRILHWPVTLSDHLPRRLRAAVFARAGALEGVCADKVGEVDAESIARWIAELYPRRRYPAVAVGSSSGALVHLCAAMGVPWLPQTVLVPVRLSAPVDPEDACSSMRAGRALGERLLASNPGVQLHHMHDPNQDRLMVRHMMYFRLKWRRLPKAFREFIGDCLQPGGPLLVADCRRRWPVTRLSDRHLFQHGALGGANEEEFLRGSNRVAAHLARMGSKRSRWEGPAPDGDAPEAEWGFEPALMDDLAVTGIPLRTLAFSEPDGPSPAVADLHRGWLRRRGLPDDRLLVESFILVAPMLAPRLGLVPLWMKFNTEASAELLEGYLASRRFEEIDLTLFAHGVDSVGLPPMDRWRRILDHAPVGRLIGVNPSAYPAHFSVFARFHQELARLEPQYPLPPPLTVEEAWQSVSG